MIATQLSRYIWNSIADLANRSSSPREIYYCAVTKADPARNLIWAKDFADIAIPLVSFEYAFAYYDTAPTGANVVAGVPLPTKQVRREDVTHRNKNFKTQIICPKKGDIVVVIDPWGAKRFPICVGLINSTGAWEEAN